MAGGSFGGGDGTLANPFRIEDAYDLVSFVTTTANMSKHAKLVADIEFLGTPYRNGNGFIRGHTSTFTGTLDGDGFAVKNYFQVSNQSYAGMFYTIGSGGVVRNILFEDIAVSSQSYTYGAVICGYMINGGLVENIGFRRGYMYAGSYTGAISAYFNSGEIRNCFIEGVDLKAYNNYVGGLVGQMINGSKLHNCYASSAFSYVASSTYVGMLVGAHNNTPTIANYYNVYYNSTKGNYLGNSDPGNIQVGYNDAQFKDGVSLLPLSYGADNGTSYGQPWILYAGDYPKLFVEKLDRFAIMEGARLISGADFGQILEGAVSRTKEIRLKNFYGYTITQLTISWTRTSTNPNTNLFLSQTEDFLESTSPLVITTPIPRNGELVLYAKVATQMGMSGNGTFDVTMTIDSVQM